METSQRPFAQEYTESARDEVAQAWLETACVFRDALYKHITSISEDEKAQLQNDFWAAAAPILERAEAERPGITEAIMLSAEEDMQARRDARTAEAKKLLPGIRWRAFLRTLGGHSLRASK